MQSYGTPSIAIRAVKRLNDISIAWVAPYNLDAAQTRIRIINIHRRLISLGWYSKIVTAQEVIDKHFDIVIVGKEFSEEIYTTIQLIKNKSYVVCDVCEDLVDLNIPYYKEIIEISHKVITASDELTKKLTTINQNCETIEDAIETDLALNCGYGQKDRLKVVYVGYGGGSVLLDPIKPIIEKLGMDLIEIHEWESATIKWNRESWYLHALECDIAIIPQRHDQNCKSNNRLTQMMALGLPIIASPLPAYQKFNHFLTANTIDEWESHLTTLKDLSARSYFGQFGKLEAKEYTIPKIADKWIELFYKIKEKAVIIIATYNNKKYLAETINSIRACTKYPYDILVIDSGSDDTYEYCILNNIPVYKSTEQLTFAKANNIGLKQTNHKYVCLLNNDVIVTHGWLDRLIEGTKFFDIVGPLSNCDKGWLHNLDLYLDDIQLNPGMQLEQFPDLKKLYDLRFFDQKYVNANRLAFYCVLMKRETIEKIGLLDSEYKNNAEDFDYVIRAEKMGLKLGLIWDCFVLHFGGKTRKVSEIENYEKHHLDDSSSTDYLNEKYSRKTIVIWNGPSWVKWDESNIKKGGIGGSEVWCIYLARELYNIGYRVIVFNDCPNARYRFDGVDYIHWTNFGEWNEMNYADYFISSRQIEPFKLNLRSGLKLVMVHDIWLMLNHPDDIKYHNKVDKFLCLSTAHKKFFSEHHKIDVDRILITSNGIDFDRFKEIDENKRNRYKVIYASSPDRGLENLLDFWPEMKNRIPELELHVYYGFDFFPSNKKSWIDNMMQKMVDLGVCYHGKVNQIELAEAYKESRVFAAPNFFEETFKISAIEAMAAGCVYLGSKYWGVIDTVKDAGILIPIETQQDTKTEEYRSVFIDHLCRLVLDDDYFSEWQLKGFDRVQRFGWNKVASQFDAYFQNSEWVEIQ